MTRPSSLGGADVTCSQGAGLRRSVRRARELVCRRVALCARETADWCKCSLGAGLKILGPARAATASRRDDSDGPSAEISSRFSSQLCALAYAALVENPSRGSRIRKARRCGPEQHRASAVQSSQYRIREIARQLSASSQRWHLRHRRVGWARNEPSLPVGVFGARGPKASASARVGWTSTTPPRTRLIPHHDDDDSRASNRGFRRFETEQARDRRRARRWLML